MPETAALVQTFFATFLGYANGAMQFRRVSQAALLVAASGQRVSNGAVISSAIRRSDSHLSMLVQLAVTATFSSGSSSGWSCGVEIDCAGRPVDVLEQLHMVSG
jgi:hypothetical protein